MLYSTADRRQIIEPPLYLHSNHSWLGSSMDRAAPYLLEKVVGAKVQWTFAREPLLDNLLA